MIISGVLPIIAVENLFHSKTFSLNNPLQSLCEKESIEFVGMYNYNYKQTGLFQSDGLHLSTVGVTKFCRLLSEVVQSSGKTNDIVTDDTGTAR